MLSVLWIFPPERSIEMGVFLSGKLIPDKKAALCGFY